MVAAPAIAKPTETAPMLAPDEVEILSECLAVSRPSKWWKRFLRGAAAVMKATTRDEFTAACEAAVKLVDGQAMTPWQASRKAQRIVQAATEKEAFGICAKDDVSETAVLSIHLGPGFWFNRAIKLKDPKGARRG